MTKTSRDTAIVGGRVVPIEGDPVEGGTVVLRDGKVARISNHYNLGEWVRQVGG